MLQKETQIKNHQVCTGTFSFSFWWHTSSSIRSWPSKPIQVKDHALMTMTGVNWWKTKQIVCWSFEQVTRTTTFFSGPMKDGPTSLKRLGTITRTTCLVLNSSSWNWSMSTSSISFLSGAGFRALTAGRDIQSATIFFPDFLSFLDGPTHAVVLLSDLPCVLAFLFLLI